MATLVRAMAAVAGIPPKKGSNRFPTPCATNSWLLSNDLFAIRPAEAPHNKLSIIPNRAILMAGTATCCKAEKLKSPKPKRLLLISVCGMLPTVATGK